MKKAVALLPVLIMCMAAPALAQKKSLPREVLSGASVPAYSEENQGKSADDVTREMANPNNSLASRTFKNQCPWYSGDPPGADDQDNYTLQFESVFPFGLPPCQRRESTLFFATGLSAAV